MVTSCPTYFEICETLICSAMKKVLLFVTECRRIGLS
jgi:hypothetical protein